MPKKTMSPKGSFPYRVTRWFLVIGSMETLWFQLSFILKQSLNICLDTLKYFTLPMEEMSFERCGRLLQIEPLGKYGNRKFTLQEPICPSTNCQSCFTTPMPPYSVCSFEVKCSQLSYCSFLHKHFLRISSVFETPFNWQHTPQEGLFVQSW